MDLQLADSKIMSLRWIRKKRSRWRNNTAYYVGSREFVHFHSPNEIDIRLTRRGQAKLAEQLRSDSRVRFRENPSEWIVFICTRKIDMNRALELIRIARDENLSDAFTNP